MKVIHIVMALAVVAGKRRSALEDMATSLTKEA